MVLCNHAKAVEINQQNGNSEWQDLEALEMGQLKKYIAFIDKGKDAAAPDAYKHIKCNFFIYSVVKLDYSILNFTSL